MSVKIKVLTNDEKLLLAKKLPQLTFVSDIDSDLHCVNCHLLPIRHYISGCQHLFCANCFNDLRTQKCPKCDESLDKIKLRKTDMNIETRIFNLKVLCLKQKHGCQATITLNKFLDHDRTCPYPLSTTVVNGNCDISNKSQPLNNKAQANRLHEGLSPTLKEKTAIKLREEMQESYDDLLCRMDERVKDEMANVEKSMKNQLERLELKLRDEFLLAESENIQKEVERMKEDLGKNLSEVEENNYLHIEKLKETTGKQEAEIARLKEEVDILSAIIKATDEKNVSENEGNRQILICGSSNRRNDFLQALVNYYTFETSKMMETSGYIQLHPIYSLKKVGEADQSSTEVYQVPVEDSKFLKIISWENPTSCQNVIKASDTNSNYHEESQLIYDFDLLENSLFGILENQFPSLNAVYFLLDRDMLEPDAIEQNSSYLKLLHYLDRQSIKNVKFIFVDDKQTPGIKIQTISFLQNFTSLSKIYLEELVSEENIYWVTLTPFMLKSQVYGHNEKFLEKQWQNNVSECRRLIMSTLNPTTSIEENPSNVSLASSILATKSAVKAIHKLTNFYHENIVQIIDHNQMVRDATTDLADLDMYDELLSRTWIKRDDQLKVNSEQREQLKTELAASQNMVKIAKHKLDKEKENVAILIARFKKYFEDSLLFSPQYLDNWLWRYNVVVNNSLSDELKISRKDLWWSIILNKAPPSIIAPNKATTESQKIARELWVALKTTVERVKGQLQLADAEGNVEEGFRIGSHVQRLLEKISSHDT